jgi:pimeloyl-ACP methyl ester carboxylesterase
MRSPFDKRVSVYSSRFFFALWSVLLLGSCVHIPDAQELALRRSQLDTPYSAQMPYPNSQFISLNGSEYHYRVHSPASAEGQGTSSSQKIGVLLVHGLGASTFSWRNIAPVLAQEGYLIVSVDLPGFGFSQRFPGAEKDDGQRAQDLWTLLEEGFRGIDSWLLVGHSYGGRITLRMAWEEPEKTWAWAGISPAVLGTNGPNFLVNLWPFRDWIKGFLSSSFQQAEGVAETLEAAYGRPPYPEEVQGYLAPFLAEDALEAFLVFSQIENPQAVRDPEGRISKKWAKELLPELEVPVHLLWGREDEWVPWGQSQDILQTVPPQSKGELKILEDAGHVAQETHPAETLAFLRGILP